MPTNIYGYKNIISYLPKVLPQQDAFTDDITKLKVNIGLVENNRGRESILYGTHTWNRREAYRDTCTYLKVKDTTKPRFGFYIDSYLKASETNEPYIIVKDDGTIDCRLVIRSTYEGTAVGNFEIDSNKSSVQGSGTYLYGYAPVLAPDTLIVTDDNYYEKGDSDIAQVDFTYSANSTAYSVEYIWLDTNCPVFDSYTNLVQYINTGKLEGVLNGPPQPMEEDTEVEYYIKCVSYHMNEDKSVKNVTGSNQDYFRANGYKITGYVTDDSPFNIKLVCAVKHEFLSNRILQHKHGLLGTWEDITPQGVEALTGWTFTETAKVSDGYIYGALNTNIPICKTKIKATLIAREELSDDMADDFDKPIKATADYKVGIPIVDQKTDTSEATYRADGFSTQYIETGGVIELARIVYSEGDTRDAFIEATKVYQNPIDVVVDCYALPFNPSIFVDTASTTNVKAGNHTFSISNPVSRITRYGKIVTIASTTISPLLGDFRDYEYISAKLYLPYVALVDFNYRAYVGTTLTIKASFDPRSHTLKYYLFSDDKLIETYSNTIGMDICVTGVDYASKQQGIRNSASNVLSSTMSLASPVNALNPVGLIGSVVNMAESIYEANNAINRPSDIKSTGSVGDGTAFNDISYPYIVFDIQETEIPNNLYSLYGKPSNYYGNIGVLRGFAQIDKLRLHSSATAEEQDEIQAICKGGIII